MRWWVVLSVVSVSDTCAVAKSGGRGQADDVCIPGVVRRGCTKYLSTKRLPVRLLACAHYDTLSSPCVSFLVIGATLFFLLDAIVGCNLLQPYSR